MKRIGKFIVLSALALVVGGLTSCLSLGSLFEEPGPKTAEEYRERGWTYIEKEDYTNALADFNKAIELDPALARAYHNRGQVYLHTAKTKDDMNRAIKEFEKALEIDPNFIRAAYANAYIGIAYYSVDDYDKARLYANKALEIEATNEVALAVIAEIEKEEEEQKANTAKIAEIQAKLDRQFPRIDKTKYEEVIPTQESLMMAMMGLGGSPYKVGNSYKTVALTGVNTQYGAAYTNSVQTFVDPDKKVPAEITSDMQNFYIYFRVNRISRNDHFVTLEYIELAK